MSGIRPPVLSVSSLCAISIFLQALLGLTAPPQAVAAGAPGGPDDPARASPDDPARASLGSALRPAPFSTRGTWLLDEHGAPVPPGSFARGLQPSGLAWVEGELWSVGDQRSQYPGHLFRIDPATHRLAGPPVRIEAPPPTAGESTELAPFRSIPNIDLEGLAVHPKDQRTLLAVTEDKTPWILEIRLLKTPASPGAGGADPARREVAPAAEPLFRATLERLVPFDLPPGVEPWRGDPNYRVEGIAISDDASTVYLAFERARDELPRILRAPLAAVRATSPGPGGAPPPRLVLEEVPIDFRTLAPRASKPRARLNINDIQFFRRDERPGLLAVLRDQERLLWVDLEDRTPPVILDLDLFDPAGEEVEWISPEGIAVEPDAGRIWVVNDPDSVQGNYRARSADRAGGPFADYTPLLFEVPLAALGPIDGQPGDRRSSRSPDPERSGKGSPSK